MKEFLEKASKAIPKKNEITLSVFQKFNWKNMFENKIGCQAIYTTTERKGKPIMATISEVYENHVVLKCKEYTPEGAKRTEIRVSVSYPSLICKDATIKFVDE